MKTISIIVALLGLPIFPPAAFSGDLGTAVGYGGSLNDGGVPASGFYEFIVSLHSAPTNGFRVAGPLAFAPVVVSNGRFGLELDFGPGAFNGDARWLEIAVRTNGSAEAHVVLLPRQRFTPVPYALMAGSVPDGAITAGKLAAGSVTSSHLAAGSVGTAQLAPGTVVASLASNALSAVPSGGLVLGSIESGAAMEAAGYAKVGVTQLGDSWQRLPDSVLGPDTNRADAVVWTGQELLVWTGREGWRYDRGANTWKPMNIAGAPAPGEGYTAVWTGTEMIVWNGEGGRYNPATDSWQPMSTVNAPNYYSPRAHVAVWSGTEMLVFGTIPSAEVGSLFASEGKRYHPGLDRWSNMTTTGAPAPRTDATAVWTGTEMIVWGGTMPEQPMPLNDGGRYNPGTDTWLPVPTAGAPAGRIGHTATWSGGVMLVWGGLGSLASSDVIPFNDGAFYVPESDAWVSMPSAGAPSRRLWHTAVWSPGGLLIWGGRRTKPLEDLTDGARYDLGLNRWFPIGANALSSGRDRASAFWDSARGEMLVWGGGEDGGLAFAPSYELDWRPMTAANAPAARGMQATAWTGTEMIVWGGHEGSVIYNDGASYNVVSNTWAALPPSGLNPRFEPVSVWTGTEHIVWGGWGEEGSTFRDGARWNPTRHVWTPMSPVGAPSSRAGAVAVWTGTEVLVWGGAVVVGVRGDGARYEPASDTWRAMAASPLSARRGASAVWTGSRMLIWGGSTSSPEALNDGAAYDPATDSWSLLPAGGAPSVCCYHSAVWTGTEMIVWGGAGGNQAGRFNPVQNVWKPTDYASQSWYPEEVAPTSRLRHAAVWTGTRMLVWGGWGSAGAVNDGGSYDPVKDRWTAIPADWLSPAPRESFSGVWTGDRLVVWGGWGRNDGATYHPAGGSWTALPSRSPGVPRGGAASVWTGQEMLIWGGSSTNGLLGDGLVFNPTSGQWRSLPLYGGLAPRDGAAVAWSGSEMLLWGGGLAGGRSAGDGAAYRPGTRTWRMLSTNGAPSTRMDHRWAWTGSELLVWGGRNENGVWLGDGARYNPVADHWIPMSPVGAPSRRAWHACVWTGSELLVWGGQAAPAWLRDGARYRPATDTWSPMSMEGAPSARLNPSALWTGSELLVWGGVGERLNYLDDGARYNPATDRWAAMSGRDAPAARLDPAMVWAGDRMVIWGGAAEDYLDSGGAFHPGTDVWSVVAGSGAPGARSRPATAWTGHDVLFYSGDGAGADVYRYVPARTFNLYARP